MDQTEQDEKLLYCIFGRDADGVRDAIKAGANVDAPGLRSIGTPIWLHCMQLLDCDTPNQAAYNKVWPLVVPLTKRVLERDEGVTVLADSAWTLQNREAGALIVLKAIQQGEHDKKPFTVDFETNFALCGDGANPYHPTRLARKQGIEAVHAVVQAKLKAPVTPFEKDVERSLRLVSRSFWLKPLVCPDLATLPQPSQPYLMAREASIEAFNEFKRVMHGISVGERAIAGMAAVDFDEHRAQLRALIGSGRASVRPARGVELERG